MNKVVIWVALLALVPAVEMIAGEDLCEDSDFMTRIKYGASDILRTIMCRTTETDADPCRASIIQETREEFGELITVNQAYILSLGICDDDNDVSRGRRGALAFGLAQMAGQGFLNIIGSHLGIIIFFVIKINHVLITL